MNRAALRIVVWNRPELSGEFEILINGRLAHPLLQNLRVVRRTFSEGEADVFEYVARFQNNQVIVPVRRSPWRDDIVPSAVVPSSRLSIANLIVQVSR